MVVASHEVFFVLFSQGIVSPLNELIQDRSGLMNLWLLPGQGILKTGKYLLFPYLNGDNLWITCRLSQLYYVVYLNLHLGLERFYGINTCANRLSKGRM
jgi:hypothetical protein